LQSILIDSNRVLQHSLLDDLESAEKSICFEIFKLRDDVVGNEITKILVHKAKQGVEVKLLIDGYGSMDYFPLNEAISNAGGSVRYFKPLRLFLFGLLLKNSARNHRKLIIIDGKITYFGSSNLTDYSLDWKELNLRIEDEKFAKVMRQVFESTYKDYKIYDYDLYERMEPLFANAMTIIQDKPSATYQTVKRHWIELMRYAKHSIVIETPYFLPTLSFLKAMYKTVKRGVKITVVIPQNSDMLLVDLLRNRYLGKCYKKGIDIMLYTPNNLHAKSIFIDDEIFSIGSSNIDYRSFRYQYELVVTGSQQAIANAMLKHFVKIEEDSTGFDYKEWKYRGIMTRIAEIILLPFKAFF
jgi:cardiolipin synthase